MIKLKSINFLISATLACGLSLSCSHTHSHEHHEGEHEGEHSEKEHKGHEGHGEDHGDEVVLGHEALENLKFDFETSTPSDFSETIRCTGVIENSRGGERVITAPASGVVSFGNGIVDGAVVKAGQALFSITSQNTESGDAAATATVDKELMAKELKRAETLVKDKLISQQEYDRIRAEYEKALKNSSSVAVRNRNGMSISSPISGAIINLKVSPGSFVNMGEPLATVVADRRLMLRAEVSERDLGFISSVNGANIVSASGTPYSLENANLKVLSSHASTNTQSHYIPVYLEFDNPGGITSGSVVEVWLKGERRQGVISVPKSAIIEDGGMKFVFVEEEKGIFHKHEVTTGASDGVRIEIISGLPEGEKVVTEGALRLKLAGMASSIPAHSHHH